MEVRKGFQNFFARSFIVFRADTALDAEAMKLVDAELTSMGDLTAFQQFCNLTAGS
jgi:hypothetical protein